MYKKLRFLYAQLDEKWADLQPKEKEMLDLLLNDKLCSQENYDKEYEGFSVYEEKFIKLKTIVQKILKVSETENITKLKFKLPKLEFKLFRGDIKYWLALWVKKIHNDSEIVKEDKYQYLLQAKLKGSRHSCQHLTLFYTTKFLQ